MKTYTIPQTEILVQDKPKSKINLMKERDLRTLYVWLGIGVVLLVVGLVLLLTH